MKIIIILLTVASLHVSASGYAQRVSLSFKNAPLETVFREIQKQTGMGFFFTRQMLQHTHPVTISVKEMPLEDALNICFQDQPISFNLVNNSNIVVSEIPKNTASSFVTIIPIDVHGKVVNEKGEPVEGASVRIKGTQTGISTDAKGEFFLRVPNPDATLIITGVNIDETEVKLASKTNITINVKTKINELNEAVVIAYGSVLKKDLTGSVSTITAKSVQDVPFLTIDNAIAGKAAGVQITKDDGTPGGAVRIRVRGSTSLLGGNNPLYVIDGVPVQVQSNFINPGFDVSSPVGNDVTGAGGVSAGMSAAFVNGLNSIGALNVDDIESITILKDASSTAIYGSKAANGVVIINTKKGKKDMKPQIMFSYYGTYSKPITPHLLSGDQYRDLLGEAAKNDYDARVGAGYSVSPELDAIVNHPGTYFGNANTDWIKEVTRNTYSDNAEISVQGGGSATRYYTSISYNGTPGVVKNSNYQRIAGKMNLENEIGEHLRFITNMDIGYINQNITDGAYQQALRARPDYTPYDSTGAFTSFAGVGYSYQGFQNPVAMLTALNNSRTLSLLGSVSGIYSFSPALEFKSTVSLNTLNYSQRNYTPSYLDIGSFYGNVVNNGGIGSNSNSQSTNWYIENTLTFNKEFNQKHSLNVLVGTSYETNKLSFFSATAEGYPNDNVLNSLSSAVNPLFTKGDNPSKPQSYLVSYYLRANYGFMDKYLVTFTGRADGSSKFGPENKFGYFPSAGVAWRLSKEKFLDKVAWLDELKLRGSYGAAGTENIGDQIYRTLYSPFSYGGSSALIPTQLGNPRVRWETTKETDLGVDFSFFKQRLQGTFDYYRKQTNNVLLALPMPLSSSYGSLLGNVAAIRNTGYEFSLQGDIIRRKDLRWSASFNITWAKSLVTKLNPDADLSQIGNLTGLEYNNTALIEGQPLGLIKGMKVTGIIQNQQQLDDYKNQLGFYSVIFPFLSIGDPMFQLQPENGANYINFDVIIGNAAPKYFGGFTQSLAYKNFDLDLYFTYSQGGKLMWGDDVSSIVFVGTSNANVVMENRWTPKNTATDRPRLLLNDQIIYNSSLSIFNSSYVKLRTATLNYRLNKTEWMKKTGLQTATVFFSATNLFTITKYPGNDPETSDDPYSVAGGYFDVSNYPTLKTFSAGIKVGF